MNVKLFFPKTKHASQSGQGLVEYALLLALTAVVLIAGLSAIGPAIGEQYRRIITAFGINTTLQENTFEPPPPGGGGGAQTPQASYPMDVYVLDASSVGIAGVSVSVQQGGHPYNGISSTTDANGKVSFNLEPGSYTFMAVYNSQNYPSPSSSTLPGDTFTIIRISNQSVTVTVADSLGNALSGVNVTLHNAAGAYLNVSAVTDGSGSVVMAVPTEVLRFKAVRGGSSFWSADVDPLTTSSTAIVIPTHDYTITVLNKAANNLNAATITLLNADGSATGISGVTKQGKVTLSFIPGSYKFNIYKLRPNGTTLEGTTNVFDFPDSDPLTISINETE